MGSFANGEACIHRANVEKELKVGVLLDLGKKKWWLVAVQPQPKPSIFLKLI